MNVMISTCIEERDGLALLDVILKDKKDSPFLIFTEKADQIVARNASTWERIEK